jgi:putative NADH-flavin reductase
MKIVLFGASGRFGQIIMKQALDAGHIVTAFARSPSKVKIDHPNLTLFQGDATDAGAVEKTISGQDAVISALGPSRPPEPHMMETAAKNIVAGMKKHGVTRLVSTAGAGVRQPEDEPKFIDLSGASTSCGKNLSNLFLDSFIFSCSLQIIYLSTF